MIDLGLNGQKCPFYFRCKPFVERTLLSVCFFLSERLRSYQPEGWTDDDFLERRRRIKERFKSVLLEDGEAMRFCAEYIDPRERE